MTNEEPLSVLLMYGVFYSISPFCAQSMWDILGTVNMAIKSSRAKLLNC